MRNKRATNSEKEIRIQKIQQWIIDSMPDYKIMNKIKKDFNLSRRQAIRYFNDASKRFITDNETTLEEKRQARIAWLKNEMATFPKSDRQTASAKKILLAYSKELSKLEALYVPKRIQLSGDDEKPINMKVVSTKFATEEMEDKFKAFLKKEYNFK